MSDVPLTYDDVAARYRVSPRQARRILARLQVTAMDLGHRTKRVRPADLDRAEATAAGEKVVGKALLKERRAT